MLTKMKLDLPMDPEITRLSDTLILEILNAVGLPKTERLRDLVHPIFRKATEHMAAIGLTFDRLVEKSGFPKAADWALTNWCKGIRARGTEHIPKEGPLLVVANHPGTYDALVITSQLQRQDIGIVASNIPFLMYLPSAFQHFFFVSRDAHERMLAARAVIRHLQEGGAALIYGSGTIDPDPAVSPEAAEYLEHWYPSLNLFLRFAPQTRVLLSIVSHALSPKWAYHPITWLRKKGMEKRRIAEFGQVLQQLFKPGSLYISPRVSFDEPLTLSDIPSNQNPLFVFVARAKTLMQEHIQWTKSLTEPGSIPT